jgi:hypothetical protein
LKINAKGYVEPLVSKEEYEANTEAHPIPKFT